MEFAQVTPLMSSFSNAQSASNSKIDVLVSDEQILSNDSTSNKDYFNPI